MSRKSRAKPPSPVRCFNSSPEVIRLVVMMYVKYPLSLRNVEDLLAERGIGCCQSNCNWSPVDAGIRKLLCGEPMTACHSARAVERRAL